MSPRHHLLPNVCTPRTAGGCVQHRATMVETLNQTMCNWDLPNVCSHVLLCTTYVPPNMCARPLDSGGSVCNLTTAFSSKPERKEQILQIAAVFLRLAIFQGADRRKQNICRRDFAEEERHLPHFKYLICCFSRCSKLQHWFKVKAYSK